MKNNVMDSGAQAFAIVALVLMAGSSNCNDVTMHSTDKPDFHAPQFILPCNRSDPAIEECINNALNDLKPYLFEGIPNLELPPIEPLRISEFHMEQDNDALRMWALLSNINAVGLSRYRISQVRANMSSLKFDLYLRIPVIEVDAFYKVETEVPTQLRRYDGRGIATFEEFEAILQIEGSEIMEGNVRHMRIDRLRINLTVVSAFFAVDDKIYGRGLGGAKLNDYLSAHSEEIIELTRLAACTSMADYLIPILNTASLKIPLGLYLHET